MISRVDLLIAVIGTVVSLVGSSTAIWMTLSKKADKDDLARLESRLDSRIDGLEDRIEGMAGRLDNKIADVETRLAASLSRIDTKLDALILRFVPEQLPRPEN